MGVVSEFFCKEVYYIVSSTLSNFANAIINYNDKLKKPESNLLRNKNNYWTKIHAFDQMRQYIDIHIIIITFPYSTCISSFLAASSLFLCSF